MSSRNTLLMIIAVVIGFAIIILMNIVNMLDFSKAKYISPSEVRGMAVMHDQKLYTLNFDQQNTLVEIFNRSIPVSKEKLENRMKSLSNNSEVQKIIIYRFNAPDIEIIPAGLVTKSLSIDPSKDSIENQSLVFSASEWNPKGGLLEEAASDHLWKYLLGTYDH